MMKTKIDSDDDDYEKENNNDDDDDDDDDDNISSYSSSSVEEGSKVNETNVKRYAFSKLCSIPSMGDNITLPTIFQRVLYIQCKNLYIKEVQSSNMVSFDDDSLE